MTLTIPLQKCGYDVADQVGGKAVGLGELMHFKLPVPAGFAVTTDAYRKAVALGGVAEEIASLLEDVDLTCDTREVAAKIQVLFHDGMISSDLAAEIASEYEALGGKRGDAQVAVRSSATAEDMAEASFAGQQDTYLWVTGLDQVKHHIVKCWASLFTPHAIAYRARLGVPLENLAMGVVVQKMVPAHSAGVMMTLEPVTGDRSRIYIESTYGVGEGVVRGDVGADRFWVTKSTLELARQEINLKEQVHRFEPATGTGAVVDVPAEEQSKSSLSHRMVEAVATLGKQIEEIFGVPMDVEWAVAEDTAKARCCFCRPGRRPCGVSAPGLRPARPTTTNCPTTPSSTPTTSGTTCTARRGPATTGRPTISERTRPEC
jgi:rifampicin phosphotransferase